MTDTNMNDEEGQQIQQVFFENWPVIVTGEFEMLTIDAVHWTDGNYSATLNFFKTVAENEDQQSTGFSLCTHMVASSLRQLYLKIEVLLEVGILDNCDISDNGTLWNEFGDEIATICWHQFSDTEWDDETSSVHDGLIIEIESEYPPPTMIQ